VASSGRLNFQMKKKQLLLFDIRMSCVSVVDLLKMPGVDL